MSSIYDKPDHRPRGKCAKCGDVVPVEELELSPDDFCAICAAIDSLTATLERRGILHPQLFKDNQLPPSDR